MWDKFIKAVERHFRFLETEFGFVRKLTTPPFVVFESNELVLTLYYDESRGHELDLGIRRSGDAPNERKSLGIGLLMRLKDGPHSKGYQSQCPSTEEALEAEMTRLEDLLRKYGMHIIQGDLRDFDRIEQIEKEELTAAYAKVWGAGALHN